jgi:hypothetical protein
MATLFCLYIYKKVLYIKAITSVIVQVIYDIIIILKLKKILAKYVNIKC